MSPTLIMRNCKISFNDPKRSRKGKKDGKRDIVSSAVWAFQILSNPKFTKHKIFMIERYLIPFVVKSTSMMINDRSCYGKELKIVIFTKQLHIHNIQEYVTRK